MGRRVKRLGQNDKGLPALTSAEATSSQGQTMQKRSTIITVHLEKYSQDSFGEHLDA